MIVKPVWQPAVSCIQPVVKPVVQPVRQPVVLVSCKPGIRAKGQRFKLLRFALAMMSWNLLNPRTPSCNVTDSELPGGTCIVLGLFTLLWRIAIHTIYTVWTSRGCRLHLSYTFHTSYTTIPESILFTLRIGIKRMHLAHCRVSSLT